MLTKSSSSHIRGRRTSQALQHLRRQGEGVVGRSKAPVDKIPGVRLVPKKLHRKAVGGALVEELLHLLVGYVLAEIELQAVVNRVHSRGVHRHREEVALALSQL